jgi:omega-amidase
MLMPMHIVVCQFDIAWEDKDRNRQRVRELLTGQTIPAGSLIVLPEMFESGFTMNVDAACDHDGSSSRFLAGLARSTRSTVVAGVVAKDAGGKGLNQAVAVGPDGREVMRYTKMHPFTLAGEADHYRAGEAVSVFDCGGFKVSALICYDLRFPERFREAARFGAEVFLVIANWPIARAAHWTALLKARAIENQACVVGVNRIGRDSNHSYPGLSTVIDPKGNTITEAGDQQAVLHAELDREALLAYRKSFPVLDDMRDTSG